MHDSYTLSVHRFLLRASLALGNVFAWILVFHALYFSGESEIGALLLTALAYGAMQLFIFFLTPVSGGNLPHGTARSMLCAVLAQAAAFLWLGAASTGIFGPDALNLWWGITGFVILSAVYRAFYWVPYKVSEVTSVPAWSAHTRFLLEIFLALMPLVAAILITGNTGGAWLVLVGAAALGFFAALSLMRLGDSYERFDWNYPETIQALFARPNRSILSTSMLDGMQGAGLLFIWPLTVFILLDWSYILLGVILSITLLLALAGRKGVRNILRALKLHQSQTASSVLLATSWVLRIAVFSPVTVVVADTIYHMGVPAKRFGMDPIAYEQAADGAHYIDEYTALKEMGSALGRLVVCVVLAGLLLFTHPLIALAATLGLAGIASIISVLRLQKRALT